MKFEFFFHLVCLVNVLEHSEASNIDCSFKDDFCGWSLYNTSGVAWERSMYGSKFSGRTGPENAHGNDSYYIFFDSSASGLSRGSQTTLLSPFITNSPNGGCVRFYYHMFGDTMGKLSSGVEVGGTEVEKWSISGNQSDLWHCKVWQFSSQPYLKIYFTATRGEDIYSFIALDSIEVFSVFDRCSECSDIIQNVHVSSTVPTTSSSVTSTSTLGPVTTAVNETPFITTVLYIVGGVVGVAVIGIIVLAIALSKHRKKLKQGKERDERMETTRQNQPRPSLSASEKYTDFPEYEQLKKDTVYDYIDEGELPPRSTSIVDTNPNPTNQSRPPLPDVGSRPFVDTSRSRPSLPNIGGLTPLVDTNQLPNIRSRPSLPDISEKRSFVDANQFPNKQSKSWLEDSNLNRQNGIGFGSGPASGTDTAYFEPMNVTNRQASSSSYIPRSQVSTVFKNPKGYEVEPENDYIIPIS